MMNVRPLQDRVLVKRIQEEARSAGGIIIPESAKEKPAEGVIVSVGTGKVLNDGKKVELNVKKGDRVLFSKYAGTEVKIQNEEHIIMREDDILGIIEQ